MIASIALDKGVEGVRKTYYIIIKTIIYYPKGNYIVKALVDSGMKKNFIF